VLVVVAARGASPVEQTITVPLANTLCSGGTLTKQAYEQKRTRLKAVRDAGHIDAQEFERYDTELLRCRE